MKQPHPMRQTVSLTDRVISGQGPVEKSGLQNSAGRAPWPGKMDDMNPSAGSGDPAYTGAGDSDAGRASSRGEMDDVVSRPLAAG